ncbi:hypothetical protein MPER_02347 [Moniliophthora perniciosa FA553]|nr:hypothetical protein MPER_02347 [Moniliophthora perniciosa FA553]
MFRVSREDGVACSEKGPVFLFDGGGAMLTSLDEPATGSGEGKDGGCFSVSISASTTLGFFGELPVRTSRMARLLGDFRGEVLGVVGGRGTLEVELDLADEV